MPQGACRTPGLAETLHPGGRLRHLVLILHVFSLVTFSEPRRGQEEQAAALAGLILHTRCFAGIL